MTKEILGKSFPGLWSTDRGICLGHLAIDNAKKQQVRVNVDVFWQMKG